MTKKVTSFEIIHQARKERAPWLFSFRKGNRDTISSTRPSVICPAKAIRPGQPFLTVKPEPQANTVWCWYSQEKQTWVQGKCRNVSSSALAEGWPATLWGRRQYSVEQFYLFSKAAGVQFGDFRFPKRVAIDLWSWCLVISSVVLFSHLKAKILEPQNQQQNPNN